MGKNNFECYNNFSFHSILKSISHRKTLTVQFQLNQRKVFFPLETTMKCSYLNKNEFFFWNENILKLNSKMLYEIFLVIATTTNSMIFVYFQTSFLLFCWNKWSWVINFRNYRNNSHLLSKIDFLLWSNWKLIDLIHTNVIGTEKMPFLINLCFYESFFHFISKIMIIE